MIKKQLFTWMLAFVTGMTGAQNIPSLKIDEVVKRINQFNDTTYIINFWATFCKPCVAEIPSFIKLAEKYKAQKLQLLLVSLDLPSYYPKRIAAFTAARKWRAAVAWLNETDADHFCPMIDSNWSGAIPATVVVNAKRGYKKFWEGELREEVLNKELKLIAELQKQNGYAGRFKYPMNEVEKALFRDDQMHAAAGIQFDGATVFSADSTVYALSDGIVQAVLPVEEMTVVIIKKDRLYFTYSNLKNTGLKKYDSVKANTVIGFAGKNLDDKTAVDIYLSTENGNITLRKNNFIARNSNDFYSLPPKNIEPE